MKWYKVEDKEPPKDTAVITYGICLQDNNKDVDGCLLWDGKNWYTDSNGDINPNYYKVTHWAEMPDPPID